jgi:hypothetical protein
VAFRYVVITILILASLGARQTAGWTTVQGGGNLVRAVFWEGLSSATAADGAVTIDGRSDPTPLIDRYGPQLTPQGDFRLVVNLQAQTDGLAMLALVDAVPESEWSPAMRRIELGLSGGQVILQTFDGSSRNPADVRPLGGASGPLTLGLSRIDKSFVVEVSGQEVDRFADPGIFQSGTMLLGARVAAGNQLTLNTLDIQAATDAVRVSRCPPTRLLLAGSDPSDNAQRLWWFWPDDNLLRPLDDPANEEHFLVAVSPDHRWVTYYQRNRLASPDPDRFIVDMWVMDLQTDERFKLVEGSAPLGWAADSSAVVLGERPSMMASVPSGQLIPTTGQVVVASSMRSAISPNGLLRAAVATTSIGAAGVNISDVASQSDVLNIQTGRGAVQLAWSPESDRLAFTSGTQAGVGILAFQLRIANMTDRVVAPPDSTRDMDIHSVIWAPPLPGCN